MQKKEKTPGGEPCNIWLRLAPARDNFWPDEYQKRPSKGGTVLSMTFCMRAGWLVYDNALLFAPFQHACQNFSKSSPSKINTARSLKRVSSSREVRVRACSILADPKGSQMVAGVPCTVVPVTLSRCRSGERAQLYDTVTLGGYRTANLTKKLATKRCPASCFVSDIRRDSRWDGYTATHPLSGFAK